MNHSHCRGLENADCPGWGPHSRQCAKMSGGVSGRAQLGSLEERCVEAMDVFGEGEKG